MKTGIIFLALTLSLISCNNNEKTSDAYGNFESVPVYVSPDVSGRILFLKIEEGEKLDSGQLIAIIDTMPYYLNIKEIEARQTSVYSKLENMDAQATIFKDQKESLLIELKRAEKLYKSGAATSQQLDDLNGKLNVLNSQIKSVMVQKQSILSEAAVLDQNMLLIRDKLERCFIRNRIKGTVLEKYAEPYEIAVTAKPIYKIANLNTLELRVYVSGARLPDIKLGDQVKVFVDQDTKTNRELSGVVSWISSEAEFTPKIIQTKEERVKLVYAVKIRVENDGSLKIGMPGEVIF
jgi:HlyD family secretion protein